jgi:putative hydrolase of the HAD superfamily
MALGSGTAVKPEAVTFDVAGTLIEARWNPGIVAEAAATRIGLGVTPGSGDAYGLLFAYRLPDFHAANLESETAVREFWIQLAADWLRGCDQDPSRAVDIYDAGWQVILSPESQTFVPYADAEVALRRLKNTGFRLAAVSNWDNSLPVVLEMFGWTELFDVVVPSLVFGHEKPDRRIFDHAIGRLGVAARAAFHVGDDPIDDLKGARDAGLRAVLIDRNRQTSVPPTIRSLDDIEAAFAWTG